MKRIALFTAALMILSFGLANAQDELTVTVGGAAFYNDGGTDYINPHATKSTVFTLAISVDAADPMKIAGVTNGWNVYLAGAPGPVAGNIANPLTISGYAVADLSALFDGGQPATEFFNGTSPEMLGVAGFRFFKDGLPPGFTHPSYLTMTVAPISETEVGNFLCIDTAFYPPGGFWLWSDEAPKDRIPYWNGPVCHEIRVQPDPCPYWVTTVATQQTVSHCATFSFTFVAEDEPGSPGAGPVTYSKVSGPGSIDPVSGVYTLPGSMALVGTPQVIVVGATDPGGCLIETEFTVNFSNQAPTIACKPDFTVGVNSSATLNMTASDPDACDAGSLTFSVIDPVPAPEGAYSITPTGALSFAPTANDEGIWVFDVVVTDGNKSDTCQQTFEVVGQVAFGVYIQKVEMAIQGTHQFVEVNMFQGSEEMWGFDFLIAYDASVLSFQNAIRGELYDECGWEYFTYRYGANGNCGNACPSGLLRVVGIAETNNGADHPQWDLCPDPEYTMFTLDFLVSDNRTYECQYAPVRFFWMDCGDNTISFHPVTAADDYSQVLAISDRVFDEAFDADGNFLGADPDWIADPTNIPLPYDGVWPSYSGAINSCDTPDDTVVTPDTTIIKPGTVRLIDFYNGGIDIACAHEIDDRGDLNLDGQANTIADAVLYSNYFVFGLGAFTVNPDGQIAASDVNADGLPLSVADLVYLIRIVVGDALPYDDPYAPKLSPVSAEIRNVNGVLSVNERMGAAYVVVEGQVEPTLLATGVELKYNYDAAENVTRVLVVGMTQGAAFEGSFLQVNGTIRSIEMATYDGAPVVAKTLPTSFSLMQNYPNPFNPTTTISFNLPNASDYTITIYNVTGQVVETIAGSADAGTVTVTFDASELSSGIYFYNVVAGSNSATMKMVLIK